MEQSTKTKKLYSKDIDSVFQVFKVPLDAPERILQLCGGPLGLRAVRGHGWCWDFHPLDVQPPSFVQCFKHLTKNTKKFQ